MTELVEKKYLLAILVNLAETSLANYESLTRPIYIGLFVLVR